MARSKVSIEVARGRKWALILGGIAFVLTALVQPLVGALKGRIAIAIGGGPAVAGDVNILALYGTAWIEGFRVLTGTVASQPPPRSDPPSVQAPPLSQPAVRGNASESSAIGMLGTNVSLLREATWTLDAYQEPRLLKITLIVEAVHTDAQKLGTLDVAVVRDGKEVCTLSLNSKTSTRKAADVVWDKATCRDEVAGGARYTYRAKVASSELTPTSIVLQSAETSKL